MRLQLWCQYFPVKTGKTIESAPFQRYRSILFLSFAFTEALWKIYGKVVFSIYLFICNKMSYTHLTVTNRCLFLNTRTNVFIPGYTDLLVWHIRKFGEETSLLCHCCNIVIVLHVLIWLLLLLKVMWIQSLWTILCLWVYQSTSFDEGLPSLSLI